MFEEERGPEGRTGPPANGSYCLTLLSEPTRKLAVFQRPRPRKRRLRHSETAGPWRTDRACGQRLFLPNVAFWTYKKTSCLPAAKAQKTAPSPQRNSRALKDGPENGAFTTAKQQGPEGRTGSAKAQKTAPSPQRNSGALKDGPGLRATALTA